MHVSDDRRRRRRRVVACAAVFAVALLTGCTWGTPPGAAPTTAASATTSPDPEPLTAEPVADPPPVSVVDGDDAHTALVTSTTLLAAAPVVVVVGAGDVVGVLTAASAAVALGAPVLLAGGGVDVAAELTRLGTQHALVVGPVPGDALPSDVTTVAVPAGADADALADATGADVGDTTVVAAGQEPVAVRALARPAPAVLVAQAVASDPPALEPTPAGPPGATPGTDDPPTGAPRSGAADGAPDPTASPPTALPPTAPAGVTGVLALADAPMPLAAAATLRALDVPVLDVPGGDPRATAAAVQGVAAATPRAVLAYGASFGSPDRLAQRVATARTGVELPGGGQLVFPAVPGQPGKKYVALYGTPGSGALGVLGEQDVPATLARAEQHAAPYRGLTADTVVPAVEIIATIASAGAEPDGSYSRRRSVDDLRPLVEAAGAAGQYVVLDLQPGRQDFVTQAQAYADLLALPHVGLALDPEWRLAPDQVHLRQIGSVGIDEVNATAAWLAQLTRDRALPQKMLVLHQFSLRMIDGRERLDTSHDELAPLIHVDGQGSQPAKAGTWNALRAGAPPVHWGWKNFYDEDVPMLDPVQTYQVQPVPDLVTYQ